MQVTLCDRIWQVIPRDSEMTCLGELYQTNFNPYEFYIPTPAHVLQSAKCLHYVNLYGHNIIVIVVCAEFEVAVKRGESERFRQGNGQCQRYRRSLHVVSSVTYSLLHYSLYTIR